MKVIAARFLVSLLLVPAPTSAAPAGWFLAGSDPGSYVSERDSTVTRAGMKSARLGSIHESKGFGTLMQSVVATEYRGKRIRCSAYVKTRQVSRWAGLWARVDVENSRQPTAFDNMFDRPIKGTSDWKRYDVVLDVGENASAVAFGILLDGEGSVWMNDVHFETVDKSVPVTSYQGNRKPKNLNFEN